MVVLLIWFCGLGLAVIPSAADRNAQAKGQRSISGDATPQNSNPSEALKREVNQ